MEEGTLDFHDMSAATAFAWPGSASQVQPYPAQGSKSWLSCATVDILDRRAIWEL